MPYELLLLLLFMFALAAAGVAAAAAAAAAADIAAATTTVVAAYREHTREPTLVPLVPSQTFLAFAFGSPLPCGGPRFTAPLALGVGGGKGEVAEVEEPAAGK